MTEDQKAVAIACQEDAEANSLTFPQIVGRLGAAGFERYAVDFCRSTKTCYLPNGDSIMLDTPPAAAAIGREFDTSALRSAIGEAQRNAPGYTYVGFREQAMRAGCVGYVVSLPGRRAVYFGRTAESHVEHFPR